MKRLLRQLTFWLLLFLTVLTPTTYAQGGDPPPDPLAIIKPGLQPALRFTHLTTTDGLANSHVEVIFQDSRGFMWFGTRDGLSRYDGYRFITYRHNPDNPNSLMGNNISDIIEDDQGRLWISGGGGVTLFDPRLERFTPLPLDSPKSVITLFRAGNGLIWLGTATGELLCVEPTTQHITPYQLSGDTPDDFSYRIWDIIEDRNGHLWLAASSVLMQFDPQTEQVDRYTPADGPGEIRSLYEDEDGYIWFSGLTLHKLDPASKTITTYPASLDSMPIVQTMVDQNQQMWLATLLGLFRFDLRTEQFTGHFTHNPTDPNSLSSDRTFSLFEDQAGLIWIGTENAGLNLLDPRQSQFTYYRHDPDNPDSLGAARVTSLVGDASGLVWLGADTSLDRFDPVSGQIDHYYPSLPITPTPNGISALYQDEVGQVWFGLANELYRFNPDSAQFTAYQPPGSRVDGPPNPITTIYQDKTGLLWVGRQRGGFFSFDPHTGTFQPSDIGLDNVQAIYADAAGGLWLAYAGELSRFDLQRQQLDHYQAPYEQVNALYQDPAGQVWAAAMDGLYRFNPVTDSFTAYTDRAGLPSNRVMAILPDQAGNLWFSTSQGLSRFNLQTETFRNYDVSDGLQGNEFVAGAAWQAPNGRMYFGGEYGLTAFYPNHIEDTPYQPPVVLTEARLFNEPLTIGENSPLSQAINFTDQLTFNYDQSIISFEFAALSYAAPHKTRYRYKLDGFEDDWNEVGSDRRFATYTHLPAGDYVFRVQGSNESGVWSEQEVALNITILPPWWETAWFRVAAFVALVGLLYGGYRWRVYTIEQYNHQMEVQVAKRIQELQESEERFATVTNSFEAIVYVADMETYELLFVNDYTRRIFGDIEGKICWHVLQADQTGPCDFCTNKYLVKNGVPTGIYTWEFQNTATGQWLHIQDQAIRWVDGRLVRLEVATDITELKETEENLRQAKQSAEAANQAKSNFLANMSHELRTPLNAIIGFTQIIARSNTLPPEQQEHLGIINRSGEHLLALINQVLELSKIEAGRMVLNETVFDLHQMLTELEGMFRLRADDKGIRLVFERLPAVPRTIRADEVKFRQVLINLLNNALKFTEEGSVTLRVRLKDEGERIREEKEIHPSSFSLLTFEVTDTGPGIAPEEMKDLFEAFAQTKTGRQAQESTGLGLPISRKFVQLMGGDEIRVESPAQLPAGDKGGPGTTFAFDLRVEVVSPVKIDHRQDARGLLSAIDVRVVGLAPNQPRYRLLIVDDQPTNRQLLRELLAPFGFDLREAENGQQAIEMWQEFQPHLIWMDMRMPVLDGYQATKQIKAKLETQNSELKTVIIALTASSFDEEKATILAAGCDDFLRKPFREAELFRLMSKHIGVEFVYETPDDLPTTIEMDENLLTPALMATLSPDHLTRLAEAIELSDVVWANKIINDIQPSQPELAGALSQLVNNFEYSIILAAIKQVTSKK
jgi:PAS domain S-box-containing protein